MGPKYIVWGLEAQKADRVLILDKACQERGKVLLNDVLMQLPVLHVDARSALCCRVSSLKHLLEGFWHCIYQPVGTPVTVNDSWLRP